MKKIITLALMVLMATVVMAEDVTIKDVPDGCAERIKVTAQRIINSYETKQFKVAVDLIAQDEQAGLDLLEATKVSIDKYRDSNDMEQKWGAYTVESVVNWADVKTLTDAGINWTDIQDITVFSSRPYDEYMNDKMWERSIVERKLDIEATSGILRKEAVVESAKEYSKIANIRVVVR